MKRPVRCGETISEEHLGALPQFSIIGVHMPISPSARPPHLLAIQKDCPKCGIWFDPEQEPEQVVSAAKLTRI